MIRSISSALAGLLSLAATSALAAQDPSFNGTIADAKCYVRAVTACDKGYCVLMQGPCIGAQCGTMYIGVDRGVYEIDGKSKPLVFTDISSAEIGKPLWLKFKVELGKLTGNAMLFMKPDHLGVYVTTATIYVEVPSTVGDHELIVENLECGRMPRDSQ